MNAVRYGSLSVPTGKINLTWSIKRTEAGRQLSLEWVETGGPVVRRPRKLGFGSKLIKAMIERQLNGTVEQMFQPDGVRVHMVITLVEEQSPTMPLVASGANAPPPTIY